MVDAVIRGEDIRKVLHDVSLEPGATADEKQRLGHLTYYLTAATAQDIADRLNEMVRPTLELARDRLADMLKGDDGQAWKEAEKAMPQIEKALRK